jgi:hypothetical protein
MPSILQVRQPINTEGTSAVAHILRDNSVWRGLLREEIIEPERPIIDAHHHLWDKPGQTYLIREFFADAQSGHNIRGTVYIEGGSYYGKSVPEMMKHLGEVEFANGMAAVADSQAYGSTLVAAGIVGGAVAHYESGTKMINLTRANGFGSLAHEWGHFLDNILTPKMEGFLTGSQQFEERKVSSIDQIPHGSIYEFEAKKKTVRYFFDNDYEGKKKIMEKMKLGKRGFLWKKYIADNRLTRHKIKDLNDLVKIAYKDRNINIINSINLYFSDNPRDIIYV